MICAQTFSPLLQDDTNQCSGHLVWLVLQAGNQSHDWCCWQLTGFRVAQGWFSGSSTSSRSNRWLALPGAKQTKDLMLHHKSGCLVTPALLATWVLFGQCYGSSSLMKLALEQAGAQHRPAVTAGWWAALDPSTCWAHCQ